MDGRTDTITRNNASLFKLVLWFVLGRGSIMFATGLNEGLAEGIIDDIRFVLYLLQIHSCR